MPHVKATQSWRTLSTDSTRFTVTSTTIARQHDEVWVLDSVKWPFVMRLEPGNGGARVLLAPAMVCEEPGMEISRVMFGKGWDEGWRREEARIG